jgi:hypothetical protein
MIGDAWTCHVCGDERPDKRIGVYKTKVTAMGVEITQQVRHCNDRDECIERAKTHSFFDPGSFTLERRAD